MAQHAIRAASILCTAAALAACAGGAMQLGGAPADPAAAATLARADGDMLRTAFGR